MIFPHYNWKELGKKIFMYLCILAGAGIIVAISNYFNLLPK